MSKERPQATEATIDHHRCISLDDFQVLAKTFLGKTLYEYVASGTDDEQTLLENRVAFKRIFLVPRMMRDVSELDTSLTLFGQRLSMPIFVSPAGVHKLMDPEGECATIRACEDAGTLMGVSQHSTVSLEAIANAAPGCPRWFQLYILKDRGLTEDILRRAEAAGYSAICLTVDSVRFGSREADWRNNFNGLPDGLTLANYPTTDGYNDQVKDAWDQNTEKLFDERATWADIGWLKTLTRVPILVKGILSPADAMEALSAGADGIIVSNHGGRALDSALSSIESLGPVVKAVRSHPRGADIPVLLDSGVRRGTDVVKALALGATAVLLGRPVLFSLAVGGEGGVRCMLGIIKEEFEAAMALCGCKTLKDINQRLVICRKGGEVFRRASL
ncbi:unnamed protein product [Discosporangium mesarthrocarpum]